MRAVWSNRLSFKNPGGRAGVVQAQFPASEQTVENPVHRIIFVLVQGEVNPLPQAVGDGNRNVPRTAGAEIASGELTVFEYEWRGDLFRPIEMIPVAAQK